MLQRWNTTVLARQQPCPIKNHILHVWLAWGKAQHQGSLSTLKADLANPGGHFVPWQLPESTGSTAELLLTPWCHISVLRAGLAGPSTTVSLIKLIIVQQHIFFKVTGDGLLCWWFFFKCARSGFLSFFTFSCHESFLNRNIWWLWVQAKLLQIINKSLKTQKNLTNGKTFQLSLFKNCYWMASGRFPKVFYLE